MDDLGFGDYVGTKEHDLPGTGTKNTWFHDVDSVLRLCERCSLCEPEPNAKNAVNCHWKGLGKISREL